MMVRQMHEGGDTYPTKAEFLVFVIGQVISYKHLQSISGYRRRSGSDEPCYSLISPVDPWWD
jgi:hypothetical protein